MHACNKKVFTVAVGVTAHHPTVQHERLRFIGGAASVLHWQAAKGGWRVEGLGEGWRWRWRAWIFGYTVPWNTPAASRTFVLVNLTASTGVDLVWYVASSSGLVSLHSTHGQDVSSMSQDKLGNSLCTHTRGLHATN